MGMYCEPQTTVAEALLDQRVACGVGNVYKSEVLWACELNPFTPVGALDDDQRSRLIEMAAHLLRSNLDAPARVTVRGTPDGLAVYGRFGKPCPRCATPIEVRKHGEQARVTYWCPSCQLFLPLPEAKDTATAAEEVAAPRRRFGWRRRERLSGDGADRAGQPGSAPPAPAGPAYGDEGDPYGDAPEATWAEPSADQRAPEREAFGAAGEADDDHGAGVERSGPPLPPPSWAAAQGDPLVLGHEHAPGPGTRAERGHEVGERTAAEDDTAETNVAPARAESLFVDPLLARTARSS
jgi:hypothetical protein